MGHRLHSAKKYVVEYSDFGNFNYCQDSINPIIEVLAETDAFFSDDFLECANTIDANRKNLLANVDKIINPDDSWPYMEELNEILEDADVDAELTRENIHGALKKLIEEADPNNDYVHFHWF